MKTLLQKTAINILLVFFMTNFLSAQSIADKDNVYIVIDFKEVIENISDLKKSKNMKNSTFEFSVLKNNNDRIVFSCLDKIRTLNLKEINKLEIFNLSKIVDRDLTVFLKRFDNKNLFILEKIDNNKYKLYSVEKYTYIEREQSK